MKQNGLGNYSKPLFVKFWKDRMNHTEEGEVGMNFSFDHLVWFKQKPEDAIGTVSEKGIHTIKGGRHETWGTYNSLSYFDLSYIEFLGIEHLSIAQKHNENQLVKQIVHQLAVENREGPAKIAIRTNQIENLAVKLKLDGYTVYGPLPGQRVTAEGQMIKWSLLFLEDHPNKLSLPFFIQWEKSDEERLSTFTEQGLLGRHSAGSPNFESVGFAVRDLKESVKKWGHILNLLPGEEFIDDDLQARCQKLPLPGTNLLFCTPLGKGPTDKVLNERGEVPFLVNLTETNQKCFFEMVNGYWRFQ